MSVMRDAEKLFYEADSLMTEAMNLLVKEYGPLVATLMAHEIKGKDSYRTCPLNDDEVENAGKAGWSYFYDPRDGFAILKFVGRDTEEFK